MKDYVFIGWSRNRDLAIEVKRVLDAKGFVCVIGGFYEGNPDNVRIRKGTINETVNYQMNHCDQAILLFQKIDDNLGISGNLIYELGYISAQYNFIGSQMKLHIVKIDITRADDNLFPSDLHGIWGSNISTGEKTTAELAEEIAEEFLNNQCQIKRANKFNLLNDHHFVEYELKKHFENPAMSDYDLATALLVYMQSAFCYQEQADIKLKVERFKTRMIELSTGSTELKWAVNYALVSLELFCLTVPDEDNLLLNMTGSTFRKMLNQYRDIGETVAESFPDCFEDTELEALVISEDFRDNNDYEAMLISMIQEHVTYLVLVYLLSADLSEDERMNYARLGVRYCKISISNLETVSKNEEDEMFAKLLLSYAYKNLATFLSILGDEAGERYRRRSFKLRRELNTYAHGISVMDPSLKDYVTLEYLLQAAEVAKECDDPYERADYLLEMGEYIEKRRRIEQNKDYMFNLLLEAFTSLKNESGNGSV